MNFDVIAKVNDHELKITNKSKSYEDSFEHETTNKT